MTVSVIIVAAGSSKRMGGGQNKPYVNINGKPALYYSLRTFLSIKTIKEVLVVIRKKDEALFRKLLKKNNFHSILYTYGGKERRDSVLNGLRVLKNKKNIVLIHDAARPFASKKLVKRIIKAASKYKAAVPVIPVKDTVKYSKSGCFVDETPDRAKLFLAQTPQGFYFPLLLKAHSNKLNKSISVTDDAMLLELSGVKPALVEGEEKNIKLTTREDFS